MATDQELAKADGGTPAVADSPGGGSLDTRARQLALTAILLTTLLAALDQSIVATALPRIVGSLGGFNDLSWVVSAYLLASTVTIPLYGKLSDLYGRRLLFTIAISVFLIGSVLCGFAQSMGELIAFRGVQGLGAGGLIPLAQAAIGDLYTPRERGRYQGYISSMWGIAAVSGPLVGGTLTQAISWRWIFFVNLPIGLVALAVVIRTLSGTRSREHRIDYAGALTLGLSLAGILIACAWSGTTYPMGSIEVIGPFVAGLFGLILFGMIERGASEPVIPLDLFRNRVFVAAVGGFFVIGANVFAVAIYTPVYLQDVRGNSPAIAGLTMISYSGLWVIVSMTVGRLMTRTGRYRIFPIVGAVLATLGVALLILVGQHTSRVEVMAMLAVAGCGQGMSASPYLVAMQNAISRSVFGAASASMNLFRAIGGSLSVSILGALLASRARDVLVDRLGAAGRSVNIDRLTHGTTSGPVPHAATVQAALLSGVHLVYLVTAIVTVFGVGFALSLEERPLSTKLAGSQP